MEYVPVLVQIVKPELREHYGGNFMLQVYDTTGDCVYMKILECKQLKQSFTLLSWIKTTINNQTVNESMLNQN